MQTKIIISDLDGTLLRSDKTISKYSVMILEKCKNEGYKLIFATARPPRDIYKYLPTQLKNEIVISYNGAMILENCNTIYRKTIDKNIVLEIIKISKNQGLNRICIEIDDKLYANFDATYYYGWNPCEIVDFNELDFIEVLKIIIFSDKTIQPEFIKKIPTNCTGVITDNNSLLQIMNKDVSKWSAIKRVIDNFENIKDIIVFGDDYNDFDMIQNATIGVAMENAVPELKSIANFVTSSNDEDGVAVFLEKNIFNI
ncbi:MAG: HAD family hydrolase [Defluviitaleaceae bacterium]|nr:HAD family hydrolase [Defluviitaleaceae bacterium]